MRHILIIFTFSLLLLTSPVFGQSSKYEGEIKNGLPNGKGTYTSPNGKKFVGTFYYNDLWNGTYYDKDGKIEYKYVNGKRIKQ